MTFFSSRVRTPKVDYLQRSARFKVCEASITKNSLNIDEPLLDVIN